MKYLSFSFTAKYASYQENLDSLSQGNFLLVISMLKCPIIYFLQKSVSQGFFHLMDSPSAFLVQAGLMHPV